VIVEQEATVRSPMTTARFVDEARIAHPNIRYDYSSSRYVSPRQKIQINCPEHGIFAQYPYNHLRGRGCPRCGSEGAAKARSKTTEDYIDVARRVHADKGYDYTKTIYTRNCDKITITCPLHGDFQQKASHHLSGSGCPKCGRGLAAQKLLKDRETFVSEATAVHGDRYDYSRVEMRGAFEYVEIICPVHGSFQQSPDNHINAGAACPSCTGRYSKPHKEVEAFLDDLRVSYKSNVRSIITPYELDTYFPEHSLAIEFNGGYWHSLDGTEPVEAKLRHLAKFEACRDKGIRLLQIDEHEWRDATRQEIWKSIVLSRIGLHEKVHARKTAFEVITRSQAQAFLRENHLQGSTPGARWCFGLSMESTLVGVITFSEHEKSYLNLTRLAFQRNLTVVGGAQKLLRNALPLLPARGIITFSNNQYSDGAVYGILGFEKTEDLPPSYQWLYKNRILNKRLCRHKHLPKLLGDLYDPSLTEHQNMFRAGARCLYDAGYQRWVYRQPSPPNT